MRGGGTLVGVVTAKNQERNYVPSRLQPSYRTVLIIGKSEADASEYKPVRREQTEENDVSDKEKKPIQSLFTTLKNEFDKSKNDEMKTVEKKEKFDGQGAQSSAKQCLNRRRLAR